MEHKRIPGKQYGMPPVPKVLIDNEVVDSLSRVISRDIASNVDEAVTNANTAARDANKAAKEAISAAHIAMSTKDNIIEHVDNSVKAAEHFASDAEVSASQAALAIDEIKDKLDSGVFKGEKGDKGDRGDKGAKGDPGIDGAPGQPGPQGVQGITGAKGAKGDKGETGERGEKGDQGIQGIQGIPGRDGAKGDKGDKGDRGEKGDPGEVTKAQYDRAVKALPHSTAKGEIAQCGLSADMPLESVVVEGQTVQNLFPMLTSVTHKGITFNVKENGSVEVFGTATADYPESGGVRISNLAVGKTYTLSGAVGIIKPHIRIYDSNGALILDNTASPSVTFTVPASAYNANLFISTSTAAVTGTITKTTIYPMLVEGTEAKPFTPCGKITNVEGEVGLRISGKNLLYPNSPYESNAPKTITGITFTRNEDGTISVSGTNTGEASYFNFWAWGAYWLYPKDGYIFMPKETKFSVDKHSRVFGYYDKDVTSTSEILSLIGDSICLDNDFYITAIRENIKVLPGTSVNLEWKPQLELGSTATPYEPHQGAKATITLPEGEFMGKLPDGTADYIEVRDGVATLVKRIGRDIMDGNTTIAQLTIPDSGYQFARISRSDVAIDRIDNVISNKFPTGEYMNGSISTLTSLTYAGYRFWFAAGTFKSVGEVSDYFAKNPAEVFYKQGTPRTVPLGQIDLPDGVYGTTNVYANNAQNIPQTVEVEYIQDGTLALNELRNAIVATAE